ncbi:phosphotransferase enzyme family protein [Paenibacillus harenae]|uniref:Homoserine kinase type II n=1 Tax=Paenibacillus harenae TaxID=306543 RepID=A0ABT9UAS6_PAEHA|nr:phosphotransferase [Paenibacillus harenae]MDQ0116750.1 homoserine kinase type II [Paenibacillus harenae]
MVKIICINNNEEIRDEIINDVELKFGWEIQTAVPNNLGYGNLKWLMETNHGPVFVKQYDKVRYRRGLDGVKQALSYQNMMHADGIPCQPVFDFKGEYIHTTSTGESYMISGVSTGKLVEAGETNKEQMYSLGEATGRMHKWMQVNMPQLQFLQWELPSKEKKFEELRINYLETQQAGNEKYLAAIEKQIEILERFELEQLKKDCCQGWAHWDLHMDNLLFHDDSLADILDFDRLHYVYKDFDISRAILSGALQGNQINVETTKSYIEGYRKHLTLLPEQLVISVKLTWYKEFKWVHEKFRSDKAMSRFIDEMIWVGDVWENLDEIFHM